MNLPQGIIANLIFDKLTNTAKHVRISYSSYDIEQSIFVKLGRWGLCFEMGKLLKESFENETS